MADNADELLRRPLYAFDLPQELLVALHQKDPTILQPSVETLSQSERTPPANVWETLGGETKVSTSCQLCEISFSTVQEQRGHVKSDWHSYNLKQRIRGGHAVTEEDFEKLVDELDESLSGSGSESSESELGGEGAKESTLNALMKKQAKLGHLGGEEEGEFMPTRRKRGSGKPPLVWFATPLLPNNISLGIYRVLFTNAEQEDPDIANVLRRKQLRPGPAKPPPANATNGVPLPSTMTSPSVFMCMIGGGHFAGMVVSLAPKLGKHPAGTEQRQAIVIAHKTFHRYTTRRKQGGAQSANDSAKGAAHSAGSSLRRYNEVALEHEVRALLAEWKNLISNTQLIFVRATGSSNRRILFGPYEGQILRQDDPRHRTFPFSTRRATQAELMRAFVELTRVKISETDETALAAAEMAVQSEAAQQTIQAKLATASKHQPSKEEEGAALHTSQIQALIRRSKAPALLSYLSSNSLSPDYPFHPPLTQANHHAPMPLHLASSSNSSAVVLALLTKAGADPTLPNGEGKPAFDLAGDRATRDAFRVARFELGEAICDWSVAHVPSALSKTEAEKRNAREKAESDKAEIERREVEEERLKNQQPTVNQSLKESGKASGTIRKTAQERREEDSRGMTPEMRMRVERERRARAAEERVKRMTDGT